MVSEIVKLYWWGQVSLAHCRLMRAMIDELIMFLYEHLIRVDKKDADRLLEMTGTLMNMPLPFVS